MLTELCGELRNYFDRGMPKYYGEFTISDGTINSSSDSDFHLQDGQYFRVIGSVFNDGVWKNDYVELISMTDESFDGSVWAMAVPPSVIALAEEIAEWQDKYGSIDSANMSPFKSESFAGYSYTKSSGGGSGSSGADTAPTWKDVFARKLSIWRKI